MMDMFNLPQGVVAIGIAIAFVSWLVGLVMGWAGGQAFTNSDEKQKQEQEKLTSELAVLKASLSRAEGRARLLEDQTGLKQVMDKVNGYIAIITERINGALPAHVDVETMFSSLSPEERKRISPALSVEQTKGLVNLVALEFEFVAALRRAAIQVILATKAEGMKLLIMPQLFEAHALIAKEMMESSEKLSVGFHNPLFFDEFCYFIALDLTRVRQITNPDGLPVSDELLSRVKEAFAPLREKAMEAKRLREATGFTKASANGNGQKQSPIEVDPHMVNVDARSKVR